MSMPRVPAPVVPAVVVLAACGGDAPTDSEPKEIAPVASVSKSSGDAQQGTVGSELAQPLVVQVKRADGSAAEGVSVTWSTAAGSLRAEAGRTDASGRVSAAWTLGELPGTHTASATVGGVPPAEFQAAAAAGPPAAIDLSPDSVLFSEPGDTVRLAAEAADRFGNPVVDVRIHWSTSDATLVTIDSTGLATNRAGRSFRAELTASADTARASIPVIGRISLCREPALPTRGGVAVAPSYSEPAHITPYPAPYSQVRQIAVDADGDGDQDVLHIAHVDNTAENQMGAVLLFRNDGTGQFARDSLPVPSERVDGPTTLGLLDVQGDGLEDVFVGNLGIDVPPLPGARNLVLVQSGGSFVDEGDTRLVPNHTLTTHGSDVGDVDCDGDADVFEANPGSQATPIQPLIRINEGGILHDQPSRLPEGMVGGDATTHPGGAFCDLDRDGDPDLVLATGNNDRPHDLLRNDGFGFFQRAEDGALPRKAEFRRARDVACADVDLDGWPDIVANVFNNNPPAAEVQVWHNDGTGKLVDRTDERVPQSWRNTDGFDVVETADFNGDGWMDIYVYGIGQACEWSILTNTGDGYFTQAVPLDLPGFCDFFIPVDVDGDGTLDILTNGNHTNPPSLLRAQ